MYKKSIIVHFIEVYSILVGNYLSKVSWVSGFNGDQGMSPNSKNVWGTYRLLTNKLLTLVKFNSYLWLSQSLYQLNKSLLVNNRNWICKESCLKLCVVCVCFQPLNPNLKVGWVLIGSICRESENISALFQKSNYKNNILPLSPKLTIWIFLIWAFNLEKLSCFTLIYL